MIPELLELDGREDELSEEEDNDPELPELPEAEDADEPLELDDGAEPSLTSQVLITRPIPSYAVLVTAVFPGLVCFTTFPSSSYQSSPVNALPTAPVDGSTL